MAAYTGEIDYFSQQPELHLLNHTLHTDPTLRTESGAVEFWFEKFMSWMELYYVNYLQYVTFDDLLTFRQAKPRRWLYSKHSWDQYPLS